MAWFGEGLSSLKGQISNFTKEIVATNVVGLGIGDTPENEENKTVPENDSKDELEHLQAHCKNQEEQVARLRAENERWKRLVSARDRRVSEEATLECEDVPATNVQLPLVPLDEAGADSFLGQEEVPKDAKVEEEVSSLRSRLRKTFQEKVLMEQNCLRLEKEVALLTRQVAEDRQQAQVEARRTTGGSEDCSQSTQTDSGSGVSGQPSASTDVAALSRENDHLKQERAQLRSELARLSRAVQDLESQVAVSQDENANLSTGMEELDIQHQEAIEQIMVLKDSTQKRYEILLTEYDDMQKNYNEVTKLLEEKKEELKNVNDTECQTELSPESLSEMKNQIKVDLSEEIKSMITTDIPDKYYETNKESASALETVAAIEKMLSHTMAKVDANEGKIQELLKELGNVNNEAQEIEDENRTLRSKIEELKAQCDTLPTINENSEDIEALESKVLTLENEISVLKEVRSNLEVEHNNSRSEIESLLRQLQTTEAITKNHDNLQRENARYKIHEQGLLEQLSKAEQRREEMLSHMGHLEHVLEEQEKIISELSLNKLRVDELIQKNEQLQRTLQDDAERKRLQSMLSEALQQERSLRIKVEEEKEKLFLEFTRLENSEENNTTLVIELEKEQSIRALLQEENTELQERLSSFQDTDKEHAKVIETLQNELGLKKQLEEKLETMHAEIKRLEKKCEIHNNLLEKNSVESDAKLKELKSLNSCLAQKCVRFEKEIMDLSERSDKLQLEIESKDRKLCEVILEKSVSDKELEECKLKNSILERELIEIKTQLSSKEEQLMQEFKDSFSPVFESILSSNSDWHTLILEVAKSTSLLQEEKKQAVSENESLSSNLKTLIAEVNDKTECMMKITAQMETLQAEKHSIEDRLRNMNGTVSIGNQTDQPDGPEITQESYVAINQKLENYEHNYRELNDKYEKLLSTSDQSLSHVNDQLRNLNTERQQLIQAVQTKHTECLNYHAEIQRLCAELTKAEKQRTLASEEFEKKIEEKEEQLAALEGSSARQVAALTEQLATMQHQLDYVSQLLRVTDRQEAEGQPASDSPTAKTQSIKSEIEETEQKRVDELYENLQQEQLRNKYLQDEVSEQHEKEASLVRELERLRSHLVAVEDNYTQEMVRAEQQVAELTQRLTLAEERAKSSSTAYTSASIRANQQVESLGSQMRILSDQKEKLSAQLAVAEDKLHKQAAALTNLQIVLEQFQRDKERDVALENERIRQKLNQAGNKISELTNEIKALQFQLKEAKEGLSAASRLTEKLDEKSHTITELKQQVEELTEKLKKSDERFQAASVNVEGKVDRCLVRNLLVGYVCAPASSQQQALSIVASVLDFSQEDRQRCGLDPSSGLKQQSLSEAFVRFLENESRPQVQLRFPLQESEDSRNRKTSFSEVGLPPARRISGSVLKDVLKQDL